MASTNQYYIKNMVCPRCVMAVQNAFENLGIEVRNVELGKAVVEQNEDIDEQEVEKALNKLGFELLKGREQQKVEQIKTHLINYVKELEAEQEVPKISEYLSEKIHRNYASLSKLFSGEEDTTIEKYLIHLKIERVKELLSYDEHTLSEIAWRLNYSSVQYLSNQFRQVTGMSVTDYKKASNSFRKSLDSIE
ncbi:AraC family transcriptional regulator [Halalkalibaculum sp. DA3122]|uniref:AraC family transcriptional regulator n=1 Tax=unclassified Halalkalibaculum TaxID=2964617 RepID=UPI00375506DB